MLKVCAEDVGQLAAAKGKLTAILSPLDMSRKELTAVGASIVVEVVRYFGAGSSLGNITDKRLDVLSAFSLRKTINMTEQSRRRLELQHSMPALMRFGP